MKTSNTKIELTISIPVSTPNKNGVIFTKESIKNAINKSNTRLPIVYKSGDINEQVIGATTEIHPITSGEFNNQMYKVTIDGILFCSSDIDLVVHEIKDGKITDFEFVKIELTR